MIPLYDVLKISYVFEHMRKSNVMMTHTGPDLNNSAGLRMVGCWHLETANFCYQFSWTHKYLLGIMCTYLYKI